MGMRPTPEFTPTFLNEDHTEVGLLVLGNATGFVGRHGGLREKGRLRG
jgi:hypothetical protein